MAELTATSEALSMATEPMKGGRIRRFVRSPLSNRFLAVVLALALLTLWIYSNPGGPSIMWFLFIAYGWTALGGYWLLRLIAGLITTRLAWIRSSWMHLASTALVVVVTFGLLLAAAPLRIRVSMSIDEMNGFAHEVIADPDAEKPRAVGSFRVGRVDRFAGGMRFLVPGTGFLDPYGFAYSPGRRPPRIGEDSYWHLTGPWYLWEESW